MASLPTSEPGRRSNSTAYCFALYRVAPMVQEGDNAACAASTSIRKVGARGMGVGGSPASCCAVWHQERGRGIIMPPVSHPVAYARCIDCRTRLLEEGGRKARGEEGARGKKCDLHTRIPEVSVCGLHQTASGHAPT